MHPRLLHAGPRGICECCASHGAICFEYSTTFHNCHATYKEKHRAIAKNSTARLLFSRPIKHTFSDVFRGKAQLPPLPVECLYRKTRSAETIHTERPRRRTVAAITVETSREIFCVRTSAEIVEDEENGEDIDTRKHLRVKLFLLWLARPT